MQLEILTPEQKLFNGEVSHVEMPGANGAFGILDNHAPMISSLKDGLLRLSPAGKDSYFGKKEDLFSKEGDQYVLHINGGFAEVLNNKVSVLIESL